MTRMHCVRRPGQDAGFTLVELLLGMVLVGVISAIGITTVLTTSRSADVTLAEHDGVEEARLALNRMTRELRQAETIVRAINPDGVAHSATAITAITFEADFDGDGCIDGVNEHGTTAGCLPEDLSEPELVTYCHQPAASNSDEPELFIVRGALPAGTVTACTGGMPILAEDVAAFKIEYRSNLYRYDTAPADGTTTWTELDAAAAPVGNQNGTLDVELPGITSLVLRVDLQNPGLQLRTAVALRNRV